MIYMFYPKWPVKVSSTQYSDQTKPVQSGPVRNEYNVNESSSSLQEFLSVGLLTERGTIDASLVLVTGRVQNILVSPNHL